jgi:rhomboid protease GluP
MCPHCRAFITTTDKVCPYCNESVGPRAVERRGSSSSETLAGFIPQAHFTTVVILVINFGLYAATAIYSMGTGQGSFMSIDGRTLLIFGSKFAPFLSAGQWWRLVTAGFLHGDLMHILMNSWALFDLGAAVEEAYGTARLLVFYFVSTVTGFYMSAVMAPRSNSMGASAALCGLLGAMIALGMRDRSSMGDAMRGMYIRWLVFIMVISFVVPNVDLWAHAGGFIGGFVLAYISGQPRYTGVTEKLWRLCAAFCLLLTAASFVLWYFWFREFSAAA